MTEILVRKALEEGLRLDGRPLFTPVATAGRKPVINFDRHGTVEVKYGQTIALCVVTGEVIVPPKDRQNEGKIGFHVEYGPLASPDFQVHFFTFIEIFQTHRHKSSCQNIFLYYILLCKKMLGWKAIT